MGKLVSTNPGTGEILRELYTTPLEELPAIFERARAAQAKWALLPVRKRADHLLSLRETTLNHLDSLVDLISRENGKPRFEALANEVIPSIDNLSYFAQSGPGLLRDRAISLRLMKHRQSYLNYWPLGVVAIISPWNYPFMLPFCEIVTALLAGNAVVFKPSEVAPLVGLKIQELCDESGIPPHLIQTVIGDGTTGAALIQQKPNKIFFTGSVATGKKIMAAASEHLIPVNLELGGKNPMIVLADANLELATSAALWGGFSNSGQICGAASRLLVHESIAEPFTALLTSKIAKLRQGPSTAYENDLGAITLDRQKATYDRQLEDARGKGARIVVGGEASPDRRFYKPTVIAQGAGTRLEDMLVYREETFGPVVSITTFRTPSEAVEKANDTKFGLAASVFSRNLGLAEEIAKQLEVGTAMVNEVVYTAGLGETPWGGVKESGFGRSHSALGLHEFVNVRHIHRPRSRLFGFKSFWWFPYSPHQFLAFRNLAELYRRHWTDKIRAFPHFLINLVTFLKKERRL